MSGGSGEWANLRVLRASAMFEVVDFHNRGGTVFSLKSRNAGFVSNLTSDLDTVLVLLSNVMTLVHGAA